MSWWMLVAWLALVFGSGYVTAHIMRLREDRRDLNRRYPLTNQAFNKRGWRRSWR